jgi:hypothetical protein
MVPAGDAAPNSAASSATSPAPPAPEETDK